MYVTGAKKVRENFTLSKKKTTCWRFPSHILLMHLSVQLFVTCPWPVPHLRTLSSQRPSTCSCAAGLNRLSVLCSCFSVFWFNASEERMCGCVWIYSELANKCSKTLISGCQLHCHPELLHRSQHLTFDPAEPKWQRRRCCCSHLALQVFL